MDKSIYENIYQIIKAKVDLGEEINQADGLHEAGLDSFIFIQCVVEIEDSYNIEFDDQMLDYEKYTTIKDFIEKSVKYVLEKQSGV